MTEPYPSRPPHFALAFLRVLTLAQAAGELGTNATWLLSVVLAEEAALGFRRPILRFSDELWTAIGMRSDTAFYKLRGRLCAAGWLRFTSGATRMRGFYHVTVPSDLGDLLLAAAALFDQVLPQRLAEGLTAGLTAPDAVNHDANAAANPSANPFTTGLAAGLTAPLTPRLAAPLTVGLTAPDAVNGRLAHRLTAPDAVNPPANRSPGTSVSPRAPLLSNRNLNKAAAAAASDVLSEPTPDSAARATPAGADDDEPVVLLEDAAPIERSTWIASLPDEVRDRLQPILDPRHMIDVDLDRDAWVNVTMDLTAADVAEILRRAKGPIRWPRAHFSPLRDEWRTDRDRVRQNAQERQQRQAAEHDARAAAERIERSRGQLVITQRAERDRVLAWYDLRAADDPLRQLVDADPVRTSALADLRADRRIAGALLDFSANKPELRAIRIGLAPTSPPLAPVASEGVA